MNIVMRGLAIAPPVVLVATPAFASATDGRGLTALLWLLSPLAVALASLAVGLALAAIRSAARRMRRWASTVAGTASSRHPALESRSVRA